MTYLDKYPNCNGCPVIQYCGTAVSSIRLCHSFNDSMSHKEASHVLTLSKATSDEEEEYVKGQLEMWDNKTD